MPNYKAFWESKPEDDQWLKEARRSADGKIYAAPSYGMDRYTNVRCWLYRKDIFEKNNLKVPETMDDLYDVAKKLKAKYPDINADNIDGILKAEIGIIFSKVLEDTGVFKRDEKGQAAFMKFVESIK